MITPVQAPADSSPATLHIRTETTVPDLPTEGDFQTGEPLSERLEKLKLEFNAQTDRELILVERLAKYDFVHDFIAGYTDLSKVITPAHSRAATTPEATPEELTRLDHLFANAQAGKRFDPDEITDIFDWCRRSACDTIVRLYVAHVAKLGLASKTDHLAGRGDKPPIVAREMAGGTQSCT